MTAAPLEASWLTRLVKLATFPFPTWLAVYVFEQITQVRDGEAWFSRARIPSIEFHSLDSLDEEALTYQGPTFHCFPSYASWMSPPEPCKK